ncbi:MAG: hypothetical protein IT378_24385 [Sandaracinaceae bacterium]|nr:hypothetical protein [Sandaracinaceae bacterium]
MAGDDKTDRFRPVFEPEDIFERFVQNANADRDPPSREDEPTGRTPLEPVTPDELRAGEEPQADKTQPGVPNPFGTEGEPDTRKARRLAREQALAAAKGSGVKPSPAKGGEAKGAKGKSRPGAPKAREELGIYAAKTKVEAPAEDLLDFEEDLMTVPRARAAPRPPGLPMAQTQPGPITSDLTDSGQRVVLLTKKKPATIPPPLSGQPAEGASVSWQSVVAPKGQHTQRLEAMRVVPDVDAARVKKASSPLSEGGEDGQMPTRQLDALLSDMAVLLRYGHAQQVRSRLEELRRTYPEDLLLLRRLAEFHVEHEQREPALDTLFSLAGGLFERRNLEGMRQALEQVLVLAPGNARAERLLTLLEAKREGLGD